jgi:hypothetical protein
MTMLFGIQFLNDFASVKSKERQSGEEVYSSEVKYQLSTLLYSFFSLVHICLRYTCAIIVHTFSEQLLMPFFCKLFG